MVNIAQNRLAQKARVRSSIYGFLSRIYRKEPSWELLNEFRKPSFLKSLKELGIELGEPFKRKPLDKLADELAIEYTRLFIGPGKHIYPYESVYRDGSRILSTKASQIKKLIESSGFEYRPDFHSNCDHISIELEFMEKITSAEAKAWKKKDSKMTIKILKFEKTFVDEHLSIWIPQLSDQVIKQAFLRFYKEMAKLTKEYILLEAREIKYLTNQLYLQ